MTGKLVKYEFRSGLRYIGIIWPALIVSAVLLGVVFKVMDNVFVKEPEGILNIVELVLDFVLPLCYGVIFIAMIVITIFIVLMRFYKGLLGDEGYLMHTLPVKPWQLITSKGIVAVAVVIISTICAVASILILVGINDMEGLSSSTKEFFNVLGEEPKFILVAIEAVIVMIAGIMKSVYQIYAAMAIGQLADKHRLLASLGAYIGISIVLTILASAIMVGGDLIGVDVWLNNLAMSREGSVVIAADGLVLAQAGLGIAFVLSALQVGVFHIVAERILSKKLNLI